MNKQNKLEEKYYQLIYKYFDSLNNHDNRTVEEIKQFIKQTLKSQEEDFKKVLREIVEIIESKQDSPNLEWERKSLMSFINYVRVTTLFIIKDNNINIK